MTAASLGAPTMSTIRTPPLNLRGATTTCHCILKPTFWNVSHRTVRAYAVVSTLANYAYFTDSFFFFFAFYDSKPKRSLFPPNTLHFEGQFVTFRQLTQDFPGMMNHHHHLYGPLLTYLITIDTSLWHKSPQLTKRDGTEPQSKLVIRNGRLIKMLQRNTR